MYERIDRNLSEKAAKFVLPDLDVDRALALLQSWYVEETWSARSGEKPGNTSRRHLMKT
jgi:hypothetical protein